MSIKTRAVVHLSDDARQADQLKRIALIFDEVHYIRPTAASISPEALGDPSRYTISGQRLLVHDFNYLRDVEHAYALESLPRELQEVLSALTEAGVAVDGTPMIGKAGSEDLEFRDARAFILERDVKDDKWNAMTGTKPGDYRLRIGRVHVEAVETGEKDIWWNPVEPSSVFASDQISIASYAAALLDAAPLFDVRYNDLLSYRYELFKAAQEASPSPLRKAGGASYRGRLGAVRFSVINSVFSNSAGSPAALGC